ARAWALEPSMTIRLLGAKKQPTPRLASRGGTQPFRDTAPRVRPASVASRRRRGKISRRRYRVPRETRGRRGLQALARGVQSASKGMGEALVGKSEESEVRPSRSATPSYPGNNTTPLRFALGALALALTAALGTHALAHALTEAFGVPLETSFVSV